MNSTTPVITTTTPAQTLPTCGRNAEIPPLSASLRNAFLMIAFTVCGENGTVAVLVRDPAEDLKAWVVVETDGTVEDVVTLPGDEEDRVYYVVNRNGIRCLERWAKESECIGGSLNKQADSFITRSGSARDTLSGLNHIEGKAVVVWADGKDIGTRTVSSGAISLGASYSNVIAGLGYIAKYKSSKLAYAAGWAPHWRSVNAWTSCVNHAATPTIGGMTIRT